MLISPKYCKVQSYEDVQKEEDDDDSNNSHEDLHFSHHDIGSSNDEDLGIHVV